MPNKIPKVIIGEYVVPTKSDITLQYHQGQRYKVMYIDRETNRIFIENEGGFVSPLLVGEFTLAPETDENLNEYNVHVSYDGIISVLAKDEEDAEDKVSNLTREQFINRASGEWSVDYAEKTNPYE